MSIWFKYFKIKIIDISKYLNSHIWLGGRRGRHRMVVGFTTTYAITAYHHWCCEFEARSGRAISISGSSDDGCLLD
jgi:hypothetical protein